MVRNHIKHRRDRNQNDPTQVFTGGTFAAAVTLVAGKMRLTFLETVVVDGTPAFTANGQQPNSVTVVTDKIIDLGYPVNPVGGQAWVIPANDPAIRNSVGGTVAASGGNF